MSERKLTFYSLVILININQLSQRRVMKHSLLNDISYYSTDLAFEIVSDLGDIMINPKSLKSYPSKYEDELPHEKSLIKEAIFYLMIVETTTENYWDNYDEGKNIRLKISEMNKSPCHVFTTLKMGLMHICNFHPRDKIKNSFVLYDSEWAVTEKFLEKFESRSRRTQSRSELLQISRNFIYGENGINDASSNKAVKQVEHGFTNPSHKQKVLPPEKIFLRVILFIICFALFPSVLANFLSFFF